MRICFLLGTLTLVGCAADITAPPAPGPSLVAVFDPLASPAPLIPLPNDLAKTGGDGVHLNVPDGPNDSAAQLDFNHYLNTLDGFPSSTPGSFSFSAAVDPASVTVGTPVIDGSVLIFNATGMLPLGSDDFALSVGADGKSVTITPTRRWSSGQEYVVVVFGGSDAAGVKGAAGETVLASPAFFFLRSPTPVLGLCGNGTTFGCVCPQAVVQAGDPTDPTCHSLINGLSDEQARTLEGPRQQLSAGLDQILPFAGGGGDRKRNDVVLMWTFSIASAPMAVFDPVRGEVPFPNDVLIDQTTQLVKVPIPANDPQAAIKMGLNTLDGFSTTAPETLGIDSADDIDPATVLPGKSAVLLPVMATALPEYTAAPVMVNSGMTFAGQLAITPQGALSSDQARYAVVVSGDVKDKAGRNLVAPPVMVLVRGKNPLVDAQGHSTVPSVVGDSDAQQLEVLRQAEAPLFDLLEMLMVPRDNVAAAWTFTTESIMRPLLALDQLPTATSLSTDVTITHLANAAEVASKASQFAFDSSHLGAIVTGTLTTRHAADPMTGLIGYDRTTLGADAQFSVHLPTGAAAEPVSFVMTLPNTSGPWPIAILQHGLNGWRGSEMVLTDQFAAAGWGAIMIDLPYHGARSVCTDDLQCASGGTCNKATGQCSTSLALSTTAMNPLACALQPLSGNATPDLGDCRPLASGAAFVNPANLFASRDNLHQAIIDEAQLVRVLGDSGNASGLQAQLTASSLAYDASKLSYLGISLGGITGAVFLSVAPQPQVAVLNVTGGHLFDIIAEGSLSALVAPLLTALNVQPDTAAFFQLANTATWILDPVDPFAVGAHLVRDPAVSYLTGVPNAPKVLIQQEAGMDTVILPPFHEALAREIFGPAGVDAAGHVQGKTTGGTIVSTYFATAQHGSLQTDPDVQVTQSERTQATTWITSSGATLPQP